MATRAHEGAPLALERRAVGLPTAIGTTFGLIVATTVLAPVTSGFFASWIFLLALAIGLLTMYLQSMSFAELATMIPRAGSMNEYVRAGLGPFFATVAVLVGYVAIMLFPTTAESFIPSLILHDVLGADFFGIRLWVVILVGVVALLNAAGVRPYGAVEVFLTGVVALSLLIFGLIGLLGIGSGDPIGGVFPDIPFEWDLLLTLLGIAIFAFVGMEYTCPLAEELRNPGRDIPLGIFLGLTLVAVPLALFGLAAARYLPGDQLAAFSPTAHIDAATAILGETGKWWMGLVSIAATLSTLNALLSGIPRILYGMALTGQLPRVFAYLLPATRAPVVGIAVMALAPILMNLFIDLNTEASFVELILAGVLGWGTAYVLIHVSLITLRVREPNAARPYRSPLFPVPQLLGMALLAVAAYKIFPDPKIKEHAYRDYGIFLAVAVVFSFVYNAVAMRSATAQFRPVPLAEARREATVFDDTVPPPPEPEGEGVRHDRP
ncbi:MAG: APC family permease [Actinobacteria bacterium]|nr:APC family permease [Actinomycetota bacterium]